MGVQGTKIEVVLMWNHFPTITFGTCKFCVVLLVLAQGVVFEFRCCVVLVEGCVLDVGFRNFFIDDHVRN